MADDDQGRQTPSLKPPSLGLGRRRRREARADSDAEQPAADHDPTTIFEADDQVTTEHPSWSAERVSSPPSAVPPAEPPPPLFADEVERERTADEEPETEPEPEAEGAPRRPLFNGLAAALLTGAVVGLVIVGLTAASFRLCEVVKGTSSCGGPGFLLLLAIMASTVFLGAVMLRVFRVADPGSTSFLAVGLLCVLSLLFLVDVIFDWWMIIAIPVVSMATFALSYLVTSRLIEPADR